MLDADTQLPIPSTNFEAVTVDNARDLEPIGVDIPGDERSDADRHEVKRELKQCEDDLLDRGRIAVGHKKAASAGGRNVGEWPTQRGIRPADDGTSAATGQRGSVRGDSGGGGMS